MIGTVITDEAGNLKTPVSSYKPSDEVVKAIRGVRDDFNIGYQLQRKPLKEYNNRSLLGELSNCQRLFNVYIGEDVNNDFEWEYTGKRPVARNKVITMASHLTARTLWPNVFAQNSNQEEDSAAAEVMRDLVEYHIRNSDYEITFLYAVISMLVNPISYLGVEFTEVFQNIRAKADAVNPENTDKEKLSEEVKEIIDEFLSGLQISLIPADEILFANIYEHNIQRQRFIIRRRVIDYAEAKAIYGEHKDFEHVRAGVRTFLNDTDGSFYETADTDNPTLVEEIVYKNRTEDTEWAFVNGIYLSEDKPSKSYIKHRDAKNRPKYNLVKFGFEPIDEKRFIGYRSLVSKLAEDEKLLTEIWQLTVNGIKITVKPPIAITGEDDYVSTMTIPGAVTVFEDPNTKVYPIQTGANINAGLAGVREIENSITQSSNDPIFSGVSTEGGRTATEIAQLQQNAKVQLGIAGKMLAQMVRDLGALMIDIILVHDTVAMIDELSGDEQSAKFKRFLLPNKISDGKKITKQIDFELGFMPSPYDLLDQEGMDGDKRIVKVNPEKFREISFLVYLDAEQMPLVSEVFERAEKLNAYAMGQNNQFIDQMLWTRDMLVEPLTKGNSDKYMVKQDQMAQMAQAGAPQLPGQPINGKLNPSNSLNSLINNQKVGV